MNIPKEQNSGTQNDPVLQGIKDRNESYLTTIYALHGFIFSIKNKFKLAQEELHSSIGRRMHYSDAKSKRDFCTPDLVMQFNCTEGLIGEAKLLLCQNVDNHWNKYISQLKKYDKGLTGWWTDTKKIPYEFLVWITEISFSSVISEYFQTETEGENNFTHPFSIIECTKHQRSREYLFLRTKMGKLPEKISEVFRDGIDIPLETLIVETQEKKFYDAQPQDTEYIMEILWQNIFTNEAINNQSGLVTYNDKEKIWNIPVNVDELTKNLQRLYGSVGSEEREVEYPKNSWITNALEEFISIGLAKKEEDE